MLHSYSVGAAEWVMLNAPPPPRAPLPVNFTNVKLASNPAVWAPMVRVRVSVSVSVRVRVRARARVRVEVRVGVRVRG